MFSFIRKFADRSRSNTCVNLLMCGTRFQRKRVTYQQEVGLAMEQEEQDWLCSSFEGKDACRTDTGVKGGCLHLWSLPCCVSDENNCYSSLANKFKESMAV
jgi:hypothetical protein